MLQIIVTLAIFAALVIPVGTYMYHIATNQKTLSLIHIFIILYNKACGQHYLRCGQRQYGNGCLKSKPGYWREGLSLIHIYKRFC